MSTGFAKQQSSLMLQQVAGASTGSWDDASGGGGGGSFDLGRDGSGSRHGGGRRRRAGCRWNLCCARRRRCSRRSATRRRSATTTEPLRQVHDGSTRPTAASSARQRPYLLERSRVVDIAEGERNPTCTATAHRRRGGDAVVAPRGERLAYLSNAGAVATVDGVNDAKSLRRCAARSTVLDRGRGAGEGVAHPGGGALAGEHQVGAAAAQAGNDEEVAEVATPRRSRRQRARSATPTRSRSRCSIRTSW